MIVQAALGDMAIATLRKLIEDAGLSHQDCLTKNDLRERAKQALDILSAQTTSTLCEHSVGTLRGIVRRAGLPDNDLFERKDLIARASVAQVLHTVRNLPIDTASAPSAYPSNFPDDKVIETDRVGSAGGRGEFNFVHAILEDMDIASMRELIEDAGLTHQDCLSKKDLTDRAREALDTFCTKVAGTMREHSVDTLKSIVRSAGLPDDDVFERKDLVARASEAHILYAIMNLPNTNASTPSTHSTNASDAQATETNQVRNFSGRVGFENISRGKTFTCTVCQKIFAAEVSLNQHRAAVHTFSCKMCQQKFVSNTSLQQHIQMVHSHHCSQCNGVFNSSSALHQHNSAVHSGKNRGEKVKGNGKNTSKKVKGNGKKTSNKVKGNGRRKGVAKSPPTTYTTVTTTTTTTTVHK